MVRKFEVRWSTWPKPKAFRPPRGAGWSTRPGYRPRYPWRSTKRKEVSPKGVVMAKVRSVPPSSRAVTRSPVGVPPRSSSSAKARAASSTAKITEPTPSGWRRSHRAARPASRGAAPGAPGGATPGASGGATPGAPAGEVPAPSGAEQRTRTSPASKRAERCRPAASSAAPLTATSAKSSLST
jgi:hypothetical protein